MEYNIVHGRSREDIIKEVNSRLKDGWELLGGVSITSVAGGQTHFYQSMARKRTPESMRYAGYPGVSY